ncbi:TlyA family RNA methyltransferase [Candidatus Gracilibacteria bacterium]|nr:TlyA family RNA methyltransferase [Candidatus Gracilibacteria bacterium]
MPKIRLDQLMLTQGLAETRNKAQALIMAGSVRVNGQVQTKPGTAVDDAAEIEVTASLPYASRGGYKLAHALDNFALDPTALLALDVGASTGGFTDVLLQRGASTVFAVDVGYGILDYKLRSDTRVVVLERTNIRHLNALPPHLGLAEPTLAQCAVIDVSFISLKLVLPAVQRLITPEAWIVALIKPQFEAGPEQVGKGGVVRDPKVHTAVLREVLHFAVAQGLTPRGLERSPITGPAGNVEFLVWLQRGGVAIDLAEIDAELLIDQAVTHTRYGSQGI